MDAIMSLFGWMPFPLNVVCFGAVLVFFLYSIIRIVTVIKDLIPFL